MKDDFLKKKLEERSKSGALRSLKPGTEAADYYSNDYLGMVHHAHLENKMGSRSYPHGSTGSRLLAGNYPLIEETENQIAAFHQSPTALIFNSGFDANYGLLSCIAEKGDRILFDKLSHASIRDGIRQSFAESYSFAHNDLNDLEKKIKNAYATNGRNCLVVTESVFSMDGDLAPLEEIYALCEKYGAHLIVDEAHATGVIGEKGEGLVQKLGLQDRCFARVHTFGKALGCHGAVVLGSPTLRSFLINFCRPLIYSTALPPAAVAAIQASYKIFPGMHKERETLKSLISLFNAPGFKTSSTPIQCFILPGNNEVKKIAGYLLENNIDARPILYPTVPLGEERLRITLHSYNTAEETKRLIDLIQSLA